MSQKFKTIITNAGVQKLAAGLPPDGKKVIFTAMAVGDGGGTLPEPKPEQTAMVREVWRALINKITPHPKYANCVVVELIIPPEVGGFWTRELGLYDSEGVLIAVANMAESYKPLLAEGSGRAQTVRMVIAVSNIASVELQVDSSTVLATKEYVDDEIEKHAKSRNHPDATLKEKGFVQLSSATDSDNETLAATPKAVKDAVAVGNAANQNAEKRLLKESNLADVPDKAAARQNLGLSISAILPVDAWLATGGNLADIPNKVAARYHLGLGSAAQMDASNFLNPWNNLWDVQDKPAARLNLGLGSAAVHPETDFLATGGNLADVPNKAAALENLGGVPKARRVNGHALGDDVNVTSQDIFDGQTVYIPDGADLNNYTTPGLYYQPANVNALSGKNYPEGNAGSLEVYKHAGVTQVYRIYNNPRSYVRSCYVGVWSAWAMQYDKENKPTAAEVGAVSANGGSYPGALGMKQFFTQAVEGGNSTYLHTPPGPYPAYSMVSCNAYNWYGNQILAGLIRGGSQDVFGWGVTYNSERLFHVNPQGHAVAAGGLFESGGAVRVYSPNNPPPQPNLSGYMVRDWATVAGFVSNNADDPYIRHAESDVVVQLAPRSWVNTQLSARDNSINSKATPDWVNQRIGDVQSWTTQNFVSSIQLGAVINGWWPAEGGDAPSGYVLTGGDFNDSQSFVRYKPIQFWTRGGWVNAQG